MKILINASNIHIGGGKTLLDSFIQSCIDSTDILFTFYVDYRYKPIKLSKNIEFIFVTKYQRLFISYQINKNINQYSKIIYFGNLPPFKKLNKFTILILSSRFFLEKYSLSGFTLFVKFQIIFLTFSKTQFVERTLGSLSYITTQNLLVKLKSSCIKYSLLSLNFTILVLF